MAMVQGNPHQLFGASVAFRKICTLNVEIA
jgi:hypothetical protein